MEPKLIFKQLECKAHELCISLKKLEAELDARMEAEHSNPLPEYGNYATLTKEEYSTVTQNDLRIALSNSEKLYEQIRNLTNGSYYL